MTLPLVLSITEAMRLPGAKIEVSFFTKNPQTAPSSGLGAVGYAVGTPLPGCPVILQRKITLLQGNYRYFPSENPKMRRIFGGHPGGVSLRHYLRFLLKAAIYQAI